MMSRLPKWLPLVLLAIAAAGCNNNSTVNPAISGVSYNANPSQNTATVQLNFDPTMQTDLGGTYAVAAGGTSYGEVVLTPYLDTSPFNLSFTLNPNLASDPTVTALTPVDTLPSGQPIPAEVAGASFVQLKLAAIPETAVQTYVYADIAGKQWLGVVAVLNEIDAKTFPPGMTVSQGYDPDRSGNKQIWGSFFGPSLDANGNLLVPGGLALFANVAALIESATARTFANSGMYIFQGPHADYYASHLEAQLALNQAVHEILTSIHRRK